MTDFLARLDTAIAARGTSRAAVSKDAGYSKDLILNWARYEQSPTIGALGKVAGELLLDPAWLAYNEKPRPIDPPSGFHAEGIEPDFPSRLGMVHDIWKECGGELSEHFFGVLEMLGLLDAIYVIGEDKKGLAYHVVGTLYIHTLGFAWWSAAPRSYIGQADPDPAFAGWCLSKYQDSLETNHPRRDNCHVVSRYTGTPRGWAYDRLILPGSINGRRVLLVINQVKI